MPVKGICAYHLELVLCPEQLRVRARVSIAQRHAAVPGLKPFDSQLRGYATYRHRTESRALFVPEPWPAAAGCAFSDQLGVRAYSAAQSGDAYVKQS